MEREITIFAKRRTTHEGKPFYTYITTLPRKDGTQQSMAVKFKGDILLPSPNECPKNIIFDQDFANISRSSYIREDTGEPAVSYTLWLNGWRAGSEYIDHSFDEFDS